MISFFGFFLLSTLSAAEIPVPAPSYTIEQTKPADVQEHSPAYIRNYLQQQYRHSALKKPLTVSWKACSLGQLLQRVAAHAGLSLVCQASVKEVLPAVRVEGRPTGQVLHALLAGRKSPLAILVVEGVLHIGPRSVIARRARQLLGGGEVPCESAVLTLSDVVWSETMKLRLEAMWQQCTREHIGSARRQYFFLDDCNHQVLVQGAPEQVTQFRRLVAACNRPTPQVQIQARVLSCTRDLLVSLGLEGGVKKVQISAMPSSLAAPALTLPFVLGGSADRFLDIALKAAERRHTVRTLLAPQLLAQHGKTAQLLEGQRVPIESTAEETHDGKTKNVRSASYKEVGMQLKVTPRVLPDHDRVQLEVLVENSQLAHGSTSASYPTITTSQIKNTVVLRSGQTVILGGLVRRVEKRERSGVPYLSRIPLLGWLFSGFSTVHEEQRLYVVLHTRLAPHSGAQ